MFVNSIDLHNNLKNQFPRIRQGQSCFSICYDACSICLIREKKKGRGCDRLEKQAVIGLTSWCTAVNTFWFATVNESHFPLNNKIKTHPQTSRQTKALMRHFYTDANYCCVSQSFIHEEAFHLLAGLPAPRKCSLLHRAMALREMSASRSDEETDIPRQQHKRHSLHQTGPV